MNKKEIRDNFRNKCFQRDKYCCRMCGFAPSEEQWLAYEQGGPAPLDCHHVCDRTLMPFGGYVAQNGISLCPQCHEFAELYHMTGVAHPGYSPSDLYVRIGESYDRAVQMSFGLDPDDEKARSLDSWNRLMTVKTYEVLLLQDLHEVASPVTWQLACEVAGETDSNILKYGDGRN